MYQPYYPWYSQLWRTNIYKPVRKGLSIIDRPEVYLDQTCRVIFYTDYGIPDKVGEGEVFFWPSIFGPNIFWTKIYLDPKFLGPNVLLTQHFTDPKFFLIQVFFYPKFIWTKNILDYKFFGPKILLDQNFCWAKKRFFLKSGYWFMEKLQIKHWATYFYTPWILHFEFSRIW